MKKNIVIIFLFLLLAFLQEGWAQNSNLGYKYALKITNSATYEVYTKTRNLYPSTNFLTFSTESLKLLQPAIAFQWKARKSLFHEIEISNFSVANVATSVRQYTDGSGGEILLGEEKLTTTYISLRYEQMTNFNRSKETNFVPALAASVNPYFRQNTFSSEIPANYPSSETFYGLRAFFTPRITYFMGERLFLNLDASLCIFDMYFVEDKVENPAFPISKHKTSEFIYTQFPKIYNARLGIGLKI